MQQHAKKFENDYPLGTETIKKSTYMDDSMDSVLSEDQGIELYKQLSLLLSKAGMHARKWLSNSLRVIAQIPTQDRKAEVDLDHNELPSAKTLGVWWLAQEDVFTFKENAPDGNTVFTKRKFLKKIATLFDPLGLLAPYTIRAKILLQEMWTAGLEWDDELPEALTHAARSWFSELRDLKQLQIPRCLGETERTSDTMSLHTFVDASQDAYGAVVYARCTYTDGSVLSNLVAAKTPVAYNISTNIPLLELMAAVIGVRLAIRFSKALELPLSQTTFSSDCANVLWWIRGRSRMFKPVVANRICEIQSSTNQHQWK
ncbi:MAG: A17 family peptidase, partial [Candidatus Thiodiazotropha sp.]